MYALIRARGAAPTERHGRRTGTHARPGLFIELRMSRHGAPCAIYVVARPAKDHCLSREPTNFDVTLLREDYLCEGCCILSTRGLQTISSVDAEPGRSI